MFVQNLVEPLTLYCGVFSRNVPTQAAHKFPQIVKPNVLRLFLTCWAVLHVFLPSAPSLRYPRGAT